MLGNSISDTALALIAVPIILFLSLAAMTFFAGVFFISLPFILLEKKRELSRA